MAFITLAGTLRDPTSELAVGDQIRFTHKSTTGETVEGAVSVLTIDPGGTYSKDLQYGLVLVEYKDVRTSQFKNLGVATVNGSNPATSIPELLNALVPVSSAELIEFQAILADAVTARNEAEAFAASIDLINDLSQAYIFGTVAKYKASLIEFPDGKTVHLNDRDADFIKITGTGTGNEQNIIASTGLNQSIQQVRKGALSVLIPTDFVTIKAAVDFYMSTTSYADKYIDLIIETGHLLTQGAEFRHGDFSKFRILPEQAVDTIKLDPAFAGVSIGDPDYIPGIVVASSGKPLLYGVDCTMPELWAVIDMENNHGEGVLLVNSKLFVYENCGVINAGERGLNARNSTVWAALSNWSGANSTGVRAQLTSNVNVGGAKINDCCKTLEQSNGAVYVSRASTMELRFAEVKNSGGRGVVARRSIISAANVDATGSADIAFLAESSAKIDCIGSLAGGASTANTLYQCSFNSEMACDSVTITTPFSASLAFRIRSGGKITMNSLTTIDATEVTRANVYQEAGSPRFEFNVTNGYGVVYKENNASSFESVIVGVWTVDYLPSGRFTAYTTGPVIINTGTVASGAFSGQLTPPPKDSTFLTVDSYSLEVDGRTSAGGGGNRIFVNHCVGNANYTASEFKVQNTGQRLDASSGALPIESIAVNAIIMGTW